MTLRVSRPDVLLCICLSLGFLQAADSKLDDHEFFEQRIRPLLAKNCFVCHTSSKMGNLQLDSREHVLKGGNSGPAMVPGKPEESLIIQAVRRTHERFKMPPQGKLPDQEIADLTAWVKAGGTWPETAGTTAPTTSTDYVIKPEQRAFWAFQPVRKPSIPSAPTMHDRAWPKAPIDSFILSKLEERGLKPAKPAEKRDLIRRVTFNLIGLPPTPEEVDAFLSDSSPGAFATVVDRLLASPHYGERWGRHWLDLARYADARLGAFEDDPLPNAFRYRDWVIQAFNEDMPYDLFVKSQIAGDLLPSENREKLVGGLGFQALARDADDEVDVTARTFLGLTVGCAQCHDHKYDPIPTKDYYSLLGVFRSSERDQYPLAPESVVAAYKEHQKKISSLKDVIDEFVQKQSSQLSEILATRTSLYLVAAWKMLGPAKLDLRNAAGERALDNETLERWVQYLKDPEKDHPYLKPWYGLLAREAPLEDVITFADQFQAVVLSVIAEKKGIDDRNYVLLGGAKGVKNESTRQYANLEFLDVEKYYLWRDLCSESYKKRAADFTGGVYYYGEKGIGRFLQAVWREYLEQKQGEMDALKKSLPPQYPYLLAVRDSKTPKNLRVAIRGEAKNLGEEAPRRFLAILSEGPPTPFTKGSGRLELAEAIANPTNPLVARAIVNRVWALHFGQGIVRTPGNFGELGDRPSHPELLDWLATRFVQNGWSIKALHREILLSAAYQMSTQYSAENFQKDPENRLLWRANLLPRLDAEALRDALLAVAGDLDLAVGGPALPLDDKNKRRAVYSFISRSRTNGMLALFDFPDPNNTKEQRLLTNSPTQRLFFLNSDFVALQAKALADRLNRGTNDDTARIEKAYLLLYGRPPKPAEVQLGLEFLRERSNAWPQYAQVLLTSNEFSSVN